MLTSDPVQHDLIFNSTRYFPCHFFRKDISTLEKGERGKGEKCPQQHLIVNNDSLCLQHVENAGINDVGSKREFVVLSLRSLWSSNGYTHAQKQLEQEKQNKERNRSISKNCEKTEKGENDSNKQYREKVLKKEEIDRVLRAGKYFYSQR